jgi:DNA-binding LacI/PurR family transcriptional regulator
MEYRQRALRISAANIDSKMRFLDSADCPPLFDTQESTELRTARSAFSRIERPFARTLGETIAAMGKPSVTIGALSAEQKELLEVTAYLSSFVTRPDITAIVAPNDEHARMFYRWLKMAGIRIPEDLSLISFDDRVESAYPYTISSINFGFDSLGYTAFHILLGDVPVKVDEWKSIEAKSRINHFATIGQARRTIAA